MAGAIDATLWIDTHEHLVEERRRLGPDPCVFTDVWDDPVCIAGDWTALLGHYAIDDLVSAGLPPDDAHGFIWGDAEPLAKWDAVARWLAAARNTGFLRAVDVTTERLFGSRLARDTCEAIDAACRALRAPGWYARALAEAGVERCQVNSLEDDPFCDTEQLEQDIALYRWSRASPRRLSARAASRSPVSTTTSTSSSGASSVTRRVPSPSSSRGRTSGRSP